MLREHAKHRAAAAASAPRARSSAAIVFLLSPAAAFITGSVLRVDGARAATRKRIWPEVGTRRHDAEAVRRLPPRRRRPKCSKTCRLMPVLRSALDARRRRVRAQPRDACSALIAELRALEARTRAASRRSAAPLFDKRGQLLPRERVALLLDPGAPFLELSHAGRLPAGHDDPAKLGARRRHRSPASAIVAACAAWSWPSDSGIEAGAIQPHGPARRSCACRRSRCENKLPFVHLVEIGRRQPADYQVEIFVHGGALLRQPGAPVGRGHPGDHRACTARRPRAAPTCRACRDYVIMVRGRARVFLAGPPLLKAATGEIATDEELGGAEMHAAVSGLGEYLAEDDADALAHRARGDRRARPGSRAAALARRPEPPLLRRRRAARRRAAPTCKKPYDMREVIARLVDGSDFLEFKRRLRPGDGVRPGRDRRATRSASSATTARSTRPARTRPRSSSSSAASRARRSSTCRTPPATWSAREAEQRRHDQARLAR